MADLLLNIDGQSVSVKAGSRIIEVADALQCYIPRFCYHPSLSVVASCRLCLVEVQGQKKPVPACATLVTDGMVVQTRSKIVREAQKSVLEFLLINHPLDCPICDQGGECELQDLAMGFGPAHSRFKEEKRVVDDPNLGPLIATDMTRCIHCSRCVRFGQEIAGVPDLGLLGRGEDLHIAPYLQQVVRSEISGNLIDLCPVGALTSKPARFQLRSWELRQHAGIAVHDGDVSPCDLQVKDEIIHRVVPRAAEQPWWISDRDRFSYEGLYHADRLLKPMIRVGHNWQPIDWPDALKTLTGFLTDSLFCQNTGFLLSPSLSAEDYWCFAQLAAGLGLPHMDYRIWRTDTGTTPSMMATPGSFLALQQAPALIILIGCDVSQEQPVLAQVIREAVQKGSVVWSFQPYRTQYHFAVEHEFITDIYDGGENQLKQFWEDWTQGRLKNMFQGTRPIVLTGESFEAHPNVQQLQDVLRSMLSVLNAHYLPLRPGAGHAAAQRLLAQSEGALSAAQFWDKLRCFCLVQVEPELDCAQAFQAQQALKRAETVIVFSSYFSPAMREYAHLCLPIGHALEVGGSFLTRQGTWQFSAPATMLPGSAQVLSSILLKLGQSLKVPAFQGLRLADLTPKARQAADAYTPVNAHSPSVSAGRPPMRGVIRFADKPIYHVDGLVRRAVSLQQTPAAHRDAIWISPQLAEALGLMEGDRVQVTQNGQSLKSQVLFDAGLPQHLVRLARGISSTAGWGSHYGTIDIVKDDS